MSNSPKLAAALASRQHPELVFAIFTALQLQASLVANGGVGYIEFEPPVGSVLLGGNVRVTTVFDGTTAVLDLGDEVDTNRYTSTPINLKAAANTVLVPEGYVYGGAGAKKMRLTYTPTGSPTDAGEGQIVLSFAKVNRAYFANGNASAPAGAPANPGPHV